MKQWNSERLTKTKVLMICPIKQSYQFILWIKRMHYSFLLEINYSIALLTVKQWNNERLTETKVLICPIKQSYQFILWIKRMHNSLLLEINYSIAFYHTHPHSLTWLHHSQLQTWWWEPDSRLRDHCPPCSNKWQWSVSLSGQLGNYRWNISLSIQYVCRSVQVYVHV